MAVSATPGRRTPSWRGLAGRPDLLVLAAILVGTLVVLLYLGRGTLWVFDDWQFWFPESTYSPDALLSHYNGHASVVNRLLSSLVIDLTGGESFLPWRLLAYALHLATMALFYVVVAPRVGRGVGLAAIVPFTIMGLASLHFYMPMSALFQGIGIFGLLASMVALAREDRRGDVIACVVLVTVTFWAASGLAAVVGVIAWLMWAPRQVRRLWIPGVPLVLFAAWYVTYRPEDGYGLQGLNDLALIPAYVADGLSNGLRTYTYLPQDWSAAMAVGVVALVIVALVRRPDLDRRLAAAVAGGVAFWAIIAVGRGPELRVDQVRYLYPNAFHAVLIAALAAGVAGWRPNRRAVIVAGVLAFAFLTPNLNQLRSTMQIEREKSVNSRAAITALEIAIDRAPDKFNPLDPTRGDGDFITARYRRAMEGGRTIGFSEREILGRGERLRQVVDETLIPALRLAVVPAEARPTGCRTIAPGEQVELEFGREISVQNRGDAPAAFRLRRFADGAREVSKVAPREAAGITLPRDRSTRPWFAVVDGDGPFALC